jgi:DNA-binding IclR family transcriptional regulator
MYRQVSATGHKALGATSGRSGEGVSRGSYLQSLQRGIAVLDWISSSSVALTAREIAEGVGLDRTVTHRILRTLENEQLVVVDGGRYMLGGRALVFSNSYLARSALRSIGLPFQIDLVHRTFADKPWRLAILEPVGNEMTLVSEIWSASAPLDSLPRLMSRPLDQSASGRCVLAYMPEEERIALIGEKRTAELAPRFQVIRESGGIDFVTRAEVPPWMGAAAVAIAGLIRHRDGHSAGGLVVSGPGLEEHMTRDSDVSLRILSSAQSIGQNLP